MECYQKYTIVPIFIYSQHCSDNAFADSLTIIINSSHKYIFNYFIKNCNAKMFYVAKQPLHFYSTCTVASSKFVQSLASYFVDWMKITFNIL